MRLIFVAAMVLGGAAEAAELPLPMSLPICANPQVLQEVDTMIRARGQVLMLEPVPIGEVSTTVPGATAAYPPLAHCSVRGHTTGYDTNRHGMTPVYEPFIVNYTIEMRHNGLFVSLN